MDDNERRSMVLFFEEYLIIFILVDSAERYYCAANIITLPYLRAVNCLPYRYKYILDRVCGIGRGRRHKKACSSGEPCYELIPRISCKFGIMSKRFHSLCSTNQFEKSPRQELNFFCLYIIAGSHRKRVE
jgi:hypothetical protein